VPVRVPEFMTEVVAEVSQQARRSPHINQRSGVSVRLSIANYETLVANATRRALRNNEGEVVPRVSDLEALVSSTSGKVEFETVDDGREEQILDRIVKAAVLETFRSKPERHRARGAFDGGLVVHRRRRRGQRQLLGPPRPLAELRPRRRRGWRRPSVRARRPHLSKRLTDAVGQGHLRRSS
jgi:Mg-chelatase subunit ChlI